MISVDPKLCSKTTGHHPLDSGHCCVPLRTLQGSVWLEDSKPCQSVALIISTLMEPSGGS